MGTIVDFEQLYLGAKRRIRELELVIKSHGIPVKTFAGGEAHYALGSELEASAMERFEQHEGYSVQDPVERLRFFCSLAMNGQDWLDVEQFFDALRRQQGEAVAWLYESKNLYWVSSIRDKDKSEGVTETPLYREAAPQVPEGWKLVPVEPVKPANVLTPFWEQAMRGYRFVLAAAPEPKE